MIDSLHLTELERHGAADGSLDVDRRTAVDAHLAKCVACSADVARLRTLVTRVRRAAETLAAGFQPADLWPNIRARIEQSKLVSLPAPAPRGVTPRRWPIALFAAAAIVLIAALLVIERPGDGAPGRAAPGDAPSLVPIADSALVYEEEARTLMNELEMRRAMLRPQTASAIDGDLRTIDQAIAEVRDALAHDPNNPALRRLLALSYRQKVELLQRATNAG